MPGSVLSTLHTLIDLNGNAAEDIIMFTLFMESTVNLWKARDRKAC